MCNRHSAAVIMGGGEGIGTSQNVVVRVGGGRRQVRGRKEEEEAEEGGHFEAERPPARVIAPRHVKSNV